MADSAIKYVGVDACKAGWIGVGLDDGDGVKVEIVRGEFRDLLDCFRGACLILVDMPIGLPEYGKPSSRACDTEARRLLGDRRSSVFRVASKRFIKAAMENTDWGFGKKDDEVKDRYDKSKKCLNRQLGDKGSFTSQEFYIIPKMNEVDNALPLAEGDSREVREAHPEVCFMALSEENQPMSHKKSEPLGFWQRFRVARRNLQNVSGIDVVDVFEETRRKESRKSQVADDDILDALVLAITAKIGMQKGNELRRLPKGLTDNQKNWSPASILRLPDKDPPPEDCSTCKCLPMEMVYALHKDKTTQC